MEDGSTSDFRMGNKRVTLYINMSQLSQYSICGKTRGVSNVFLTIFDYFAGVNENVGGWEAPEGVHPQSTTNRALDMTNTESDLVRDNWL